MNIWRSCRISGTASASWWRMFGTAESRRSEPY
jgi:hypothetical protein